MNSSQGMYLLPPGLHTINRAIVNSSTLPNLFPASPCPSLILWPLRMIVRGIQHSSAEAGISWPTWLDALLGPFEQSHCCLSNIKGFESIGSYLHASGASTVCIDAQIMRASQSAVCLGKLALILLQKILSGAFG